MKTIFVVISIILIVIIGMWLKYSNNKNQTTVNLDEAQARVIAEQKIQSNNPDHPMVITKTDTKDDGWIFYYTTKKYIETTDPIDAVPGNQPLFVKKDGTTEWSTIGNWGKK